MTSEDSQYLDKILKTIETLPAYIKGSLLKIKELDDYCNGKPLRPLLD